MTSTTQYGFDRKTSHAQYFIDTWQKYVTENKLDRIDPHKFFDGCLYWLLEACTTTAIDIDMVTRNLQWLGNGLFEDASRPGLTRTQQKALQTVGRMLTKTNISPPGTLTISWAVHPLWRPKTVAFIATQLMTHVQSLFYIHNNQHPILNTRVNTNIFKSVTLDRETARTFHT